MYENSPRVGEPLVSTAKVTYTIMPDFGGAYGWIMRGDDDRSKGLGGCHASGGDWSGEHSISVDLQMAFAEWQGLFESSGYDDQLGDDQFDWPSFHARGIELSRRAKAEIGDAARIVYEKPMEDPHYRSEERREVLVDGSLRLLESRAQLFGMTFRQLVVRIVSGGQTGVDRAALDWAIERGMEHGGWCPRGRKAEDGPIDARYRLRELDSANYRTRTRQNVIDSDGTLILNVGDLSDGTLETQRFAQQFDKAHLLVNLDEAALEAASDGALDWLRASPIETLNVAGPRESKRPGNYAAARAFLDLLGRPSLPRNPK